MPNSLPPNFKCGCSMCRCNASCYTYTSARYTRNSHGNTKAGCIIKSAVNNRDFIVLVQSCGRMWGPPKGTVEPNETIRDCAVREVREETGLDVSDHVSATAVPVRLNSKYYYYVVNIENIPVLHVQHGYAHNDANAVGVFSVECVIKNIRENRFQANQHLKLVLEYFGIDL